MIWLMSETTSSPEPATHPVAATQTTQPASPPPPRERRPGRLTAVAALVGIVAGTVFIVAVIFFTGFILGAHSGGHGGGHGGGERHHESMMFHRGGPPMGPSGEFERRLPSGFGERGEQGIQPQQPSSSSVTTPAPARP